MTVMPDQIDLSPQRVIDMDRRIRRLNPFVLPVIACLDKAIGANREKTEWEQIGDVLTGMHEIADRIEDMHDD